MSDMSDALMYAYTQARCKLIERTVISYIKSRYRTLCRCPEVIALKGFWGPKIRIDRRTSVRILIATGFFGCPRALPTELKGIAV